MPQPGLCGDSFAPAPEPREERLNAAWLQKDREAGAERLLNPFAGARTFERYACHPLSVFGDCGAASAAALGSDKDGLTVGGIWCRSETRYETRKPRMGVSRYERPRITIAISVQASARHS